jgi:hypothetical protein
LYKCTQSELEKEDEYYLNLDFNIMQIEKREKYLESKRQEQQMKAKRK